MTVDRCNASGAAPLNPLTVCLIGQPYWAAKLEESLTAFGGTRLNVFQLPLESWRFFGSLRKALTADIFLSTGFRPGAATMRGFAFDILWTLLRLCNRRAAGVFYWLGTDVLNTTRDFQAGKLRGWCFRRAKKDFHVADAPWLAEELGEMGIKAVSKTLTLPPLISGHPPELPDRFSVLTYIPDFRSRFYGGECIYEAARRLPEIRFDVVGGLGDWVPQHLDNLVFHGWQTDMHRFYCDATVLVRLVEHDGTGLTAIEALSLGRHVIYSLPLPHTIPVACGDGDGLVKTLSSLFRLHQHGVLHLNTAGRTYIEENFDHDRCMEDLISYLLIAAGDKPGRRKDRNER